MPPKGATRGSKVNKVVELLARSRAGDEDAREDLEPIIYDELHRQASALFKSDRADTPWQPTVLVAQASLELAGVKLEGPDREHFLAVGATAMRSLLSDYARGKAKDKRHAGKRVLLASEVPGDVAETDLVALDDALAHLSDIEPRHARIAELRFLADLSVEETARVLGVSTRTVELDWRSARVWLRRQLGGGR